MHISTDARTLFVVSALQIFSVVHLFADVSFYDQRQISAYSRLPICLLIHAIYIKSMVDDVASGWLIPQHVKPNDPHPSFLVVRLLNNNVSQLGRGTFL